MKKTILILMFPLLYLALPAQKKDEAEKLVEEGIALHDKGEYDKAIAKYNKALELDKDNFLALAEKGISLLTVGKYQESIECCKRVISAHPDEPGLQSVYVTYGTCFDALHQPEKSIEAYSEGIKQFPDAYLLHFNKGITLSGLNKYDEALLCFQTSIQLNPKHPGSHNAIARLKQMKEKRIPALLAYCRFMVLEPESNRALENLKSIQEIMTGGAEKSGSNSITINISPDMLGDTTANGDPAENSFTTTDLILSMGAALDFDKKNKKETPVEQFKRKFELVCSSLKESQDKNSGFYWEYYVPYFIEMKEENLLETFAYIVFASSGDSDVTNWFKSHKTEVDKFYGWSKTFNWYTE